MAGASGAAVAAGSVVVTGTFVCSSARADRGVPVRARAVDGRTVRVTLVGSQGAPRWSAADRGRTSLRLGGDPAGPLRSSQCIETQGVTTGQPKYTPMVRDGGPAGV
ncbi:hypothetical protein JCM11754A_40710 [Isoptericola variabilis]